MGPTSEVSEDDALEEGEDEDDESRSISMNWTVWAFPDLWRWWASIRGLRLTPEILLCLSD